MRKGPGALKLDLTRFARSLPSSYELLPEYGCVRSSTGELMKTTEVQLGVLDSARVADGMRFHEQLDSCDTPAYPLVPIVGINQPTPTTVELLDDRAITHTVLDGADRGGDGTVPRLAARPRAMAGTDPVIRGVGEGHGLLVAHRSVTDQLDYLLTAEKTIYAAAASPDAIGVFVPDLHDAGDPITVEVSHPSQRTLEVLAIDEAGKESAWARVRYRGETDGAGRQVGHATLERVSPGGHTIVVRAPSDQRGASVAPVGSMTLVLA